MNNSRGSLLLGVAMLFFVVAVLAAGVGRYLLWQQGINAPRATPEVTSGGVLEPAFIVEPALAEDTKELQRTLVTPLRAYYATRDEHVSNIVVAPAESDDHTAQVTLEIATPDGPREQIFFFDRTGKDLQGPYPTWEPAHLDQTE
jgi:hypothetical protein